MVKASTASASGRKISNANVSSQGSRVAREIQELCETGQYDTTFSQWKK